MMDSEDPQLDRQLSNMIREHGEIDSDHKFDNSSHSSISNTEDKSSINCSI